MGNQTFGLPGNGSNTSGRFISIEGNTDVDGEGSSRIFFAEHNSTTAAMDSYGISLGYRGGGTSIVGASGNTWTGLSQIANGQWGMWGHDNNATGSLIMYGDRVATFVDFAGNNIQGIGNITISGNINFGSSNGYVNLSRGSFITFYEDGNTNHAIGSRDSAGAEADDIRINSYGAVYINLDSNNNNTSGADFRIGRHGSGTGTMSTLFTISGENGDATFNNDLYIPDQIIHTGDTNTYIQFHAADQWRVVTGGVERFEVNNSFVTVAGSFRELSDAKLKENVVQIDGALNLVEQLRGVYYTRKDSEDKSKKVGFIAQEVQKIIPEVVSKNDEDTLSVSYTHMVALLTEAIKELSQQNKELIERVNKLENKLN
jgi:hypothetical protein